MKRPIAQWLLPNISHPGLDPGSKDTITIIELGMRSPRGGGDDNNHKNKGSRSRPYLFQ